MSSTALPTTAYSDAFVGGPPKEGVSRVQNRLAKARILADELAEYFAARKELEAAYLKALQKISRRTFLSDPTALPPAFLPVYERLVAEIAEVASVHGELEKKIETECELPMRSAANKGEWGRQKEHDDSIASTLKEINSLESQLAKDQKKAESVSSKKAQSAQAKAEETQRALAQSMEAWETEAPFVFEAYQRIDGSRLDLMKEVVAKFETVQSDAAQRLMQVTEQTMQTTLSFDPQADMQEFLLKNATAKAPGGLNRSGSRSRRAQTPNARPPPPPVPAPRGTPAGNGFTAQPASSSNDYGVGPSSASIHSVGSARAGSVTQTPKGGSSLKSALSRFGRGRPSKVTPDAANSSYGNLAETDETRPMGPPRTRTADRAPQLGLPNDIAGGQAGSGAGLMAPLVPSQRTAASSAPPPASAPQVDAEGYSIPPPDRKPWETGPTGASLMDDDDDDDATGEVENSLSSLPRPIAGMSISNRPVAESSQQDKEALEKMRSTLLTARSPAAAPARRNTTRRDRRDVRNTTYNPGMNLDDGAGAGGLRPISQFGVPQSSTPKAISPMNTGGAFQGLPGVGPERSQSLMSASSGAAAAAAAASNPFEAAGATPGLRASIVETVNVLFTGRDVTRIMVVGEVSVSLRDVGLSGEPLHLRLDAFEQLEKAAPNPAFLKPIGGDKPGEYQLDVAALLAQGSSVAGGVAPGSGGTATLLKYQLHVSEARRKEYVPVDIAAQWRCEPHQTSLLLTYSPNAESRLAASADTATVEELSFATTAAPTNVTSVMSKPTGSWSPENRRMGWIVDEPLPLSGADAGARKILARFQVDGQAQPQPVLVRFRIPGRSLSSLGLSVVHDSTTAPSQLAFDDVARQIVSGKYIANP